MGRSVGKRTVKAKKPVSRRREVNLFNFADDLEGDMFDFDEPFDDGTFFPEPAQTTRDLTTVAITLPLVGVTTSLISRL